MENYNYNKVNELVASIENKYEQEFIEQQRAFEANKAAMTKALDVFYSLVPKLNEFANTNKFQITYISTSRQGMSDSWDVFKSLEVNIHLKPTSKFNFIKYNKVNSETKLKSLVATKSQPICNKFLSVVGFESVIATYSLMEGGNDTIVLGFKIKL